jgi:hypothetical protein
MCIQKMIWLHGKVAKKENPAAQAGSSPRSEYYLERALPESVRFNAGMKKGKTYR